MSGHTLAETSAKYNVSECSIRLFEKEYGVSESAKDARKNMRAKKELADMSARKARKKQKRTVWIRCTASSGYWKTKYI